MSALSLSCLVVHQEITSHGCAGSKWGGCHLKRSSPEVGRNRASSPEGGRAGNRDRASSPEVGGPAVRDRCSSPECGRAAVRDRASSPEIGSAAVRDRDCFQKQCRATSSSRSGWQEGDCTAAWQWRQPSCSCQDIRCGTVRQTRVAKSLAKCARKQQGLIVCRPG